MKGRRSLPPECDSLCPYRSCFSPGEDKGTFNQGRGYTHYHKLPKLCCMTRLLHGCPLGPDTLAENGFTSLRPTPNWDRVLLDLKREAAEAKCTLKVGNLLHRHLSLLRAAVRYIPQEKRENAEGEGN